MHSPNPRPIVSISILFTQVIFLFLVCTSDFLYIGTRVAVLWFLFLAVSLWYVACTFFFPSDCHVCYWRLSFPTLSYPYSVTMRTPVLTTTSTHPSRLSLTITCASGEIVVLRSSSRVPNPITPYSSFLKPRQPLFVSPPVPLSSIDTPCHFF
jgi:hypothetical protein